LRPAYLSETYLDDDLPEGSYVYFEVVDSGCGMDRETRARIFDPFFTTKFAGRGLGMAAVLGIVRGHKGAIKVYSEVGRGSTFKVLFPGGGRGAGDRGPDRWANDDWKSRGVVLVADDEESIRVLARKTLERAGFQVLLAKDGRQAVELFRDQGEAIRFVLLDMTMPHLDGQETFRELRRIRKDVTVILSSGYNEKEATEAFVGKGLAGFIQKPYRPTELLALVRGVLEGSGG
jgi:two-component system, cell cycle sensor histidine kinase and response regulator CckA